MGNILRRKKIIKKNNVFHCDCYKCNDRYDSFGRNGMIWTPKSFAEDHGEHLYIYEVDQLERMRKYGLKDLNNEDIYSEVMLDTFKKQGLIKNTII